MTRADRLLLAGVVLYVVLSGIHGVVHGIVPVTIPAWQFALVVVALFALPLTGGVLVVRGRGRTGAWLVLLGTVAGLAFEVVAHFLVDNPDHVSQVGHAAFAPTAVGSALGTALAALSAGWYLRRHGQRGSHRSPLHAGTR